MAKLVGSPTYDSTFTYQKGAKNTSLVGLLFNKGVMDSHSLHKVPHSFSKVVLSERTFITTGVAIVDNTKSTIHVGGHTSRTVCHMPLASKKIGAIPEFSFWEL
jgi:hypothetical protein